MQKPKKYDWCDSNMALFGSDTEKKVKKESAESEPAWGCSLGKEGDLTLVWRIVKFKVEHWDTDQYGDFYNGDSYIVYNQTVDKEGEKLDKNVHFWIGKYSTQDEYGTAAYKTVELDTLHDDAPVQHREVQGHESKLFKSYFPNLTLLKGGADTGFKRVLPEAYIPRLFHIQKQSNKKIVCNEVSKKKSNLTPEDVFIIDMGATIYQYNGSKCSHDEKFKAAQEIARMKSLRGKVRVETLEERSTAKDHTALCCLADGEKKAKSDVKAEPAMFRVSDADGSLDMEDVAKGADISKDLLETDNVFVINTGDHVYCWVGKGASVDERKNGLAYASNYLNKTETPWLPISVVSEGNEGEDFNQAF